MTLLLSTIVRSKHQFHAIIHAQPLHLTYLNHIQRYQDQRYLNQHILCWQPESIVNLPEGIGYLPFLLPDSPELMAATVAKLRQHRVVVWAKHGVMARSDQSVKRATPNNKPRPTPCPAARHAPPRPTSGVDQIK